MPRTLLFLAFLLLNTLVVHYVLFFFSGESKDDMPRLRGAPRVDAELPVKVAPRLAARPPHAPSLSYDSSKFAASLPYLEVTTGLPPLVEKSWLFSYPAWVLPPPLQLQANSRHPIMEKSPFQQAELAESHFYCSLPNATTCCLSPRKCLADYHPRDCETDGLNCGPSSDFVVNNHPKYRNGRVDFIRDGAIDFRHFDCGWKSDHMEALKSVLDSVYISESPVIYLDIPMGYLFQHFLDGTVPKMMQVESLLANPEYKLFMEVSKSHHRINHDLLHRMGISDDRIIYRNQLSAQYKYISAPLLVIPCNTPPIHPYLWRHAQYVMKLPFLTDPASAEGPEIIIYLTRSHGAQSERQVRNDKDVIEFLQTYFANNGRYEFQVFRSNQSETLEDKMKFWSRVRVMIGPHGGAFQNVMFTRPGVKMIEFQLSSKPYLSEAVRFIMHRQGVMMGHDYYSILCETIGLSMKVDVQELKSVLDFVMGGPK